MSREDRGNIMVRQQKQNKIKQENKDIWVNGMLHAEPVRLSTTATNDGRLGKDGERPNKYMTLCR